MVAGIVAVADDQSAEFAGDVTVAFTVGEEDATGSSAAEVREALVDRVVAGDGEFRDRHWRIKKLGNQENGQLAL